MQPPLPSITPTWHNDTYSAIDPSKPEHSQANKTVIITGAGSGIGRATALSYAKASAKHIVLIGRTESTLRETEALLSKTSASASVFACSVTDEDAIKKVAGEVGAWDVLILNAGRISSPAPIVKASLGDWWNDYETNVKSVIIASQAFIPTAKSGAALYAITAGALAMPPKHTPYISAYLSSKVAQVKVMEFLAAENPELFICSVHPGMVDTNILRGSGADPKQLPMDTVELSADFLVWLSQPKTAFLGGKMLFANWDVEELCAKAEEIKDSDKLTIMYGGWPFM